MALRALDGQSENIMSSSNDNAGAQTTAGRLPVVFLPHGGGPWPFVDMGMDRGELDSLANYLRALPELPSAPPKALLVISAHWEETAPTVMTAERPSLLYDYYGFPPESYHLTWPAPGDPELAGRVRALLGDAGFETRANAERGFDHGTFIPLKVSYPDAKIPTVQLSLQTGLDPERHIALGRALAPLRSEGVFILGSGMSFHNLRALRDPRAGGPAREFDQWLRESAVLPQEERDRRLTSWAQAPSARFSHPREEHLLPLMVVAGAAGADRGRVGYEGQMFGLPLSAFHFG